MFQRIIALCVALLPCTLGRAADSYTVTVSAGESERIGTPAGEFDTLKFVRTNEGSGETAEVWLATERSYLPVRTVLVEKDGTRYEHIATRISQ